LTLPPRLELLRPLLLLLLLPLLHLHLHLHLHLVFIATLCAPTAQAFLTKDLL